MGPRPSLRHSIDRIDGTRWYEPGNCRWATHDVQCRNKRSNVNITHPATGETMCMVDWAKRLGVRKSTLSWRLQRWPLERALEAGDHRKDQRGLDLAEAVIALEHTASARGVAR